MGTILNIIAIVAYIIICYFWNKAIKKRDEQITELFEQILLERKSNDINTAWCLGMVKMDAIRKEDIERLENHGWFITVYEAEKVKQYKNHLVICQETSLVKERLSLACV